MKIDIKKIKISSTKQNLTLVYDETTAQDVVSAHAVKSAELPEPELYDALRSLLIDFEEITQIKDSEVLDRLIMTGISISEKGVTLIAQYHLAMGGVMSLCTPHRAYEDMPSAFEKRLDLITHHALRFINGERAQKGLFDMAKLDKKDFDECDPTEQSIKIKMSSPLIRKRALEKGLVAA